MSDVTREQVQEELNKRAKSVSEADVEEILKKQTDIREKFTTNSPLGRFINDVTLLFSMIGDYWSGSYREVPWTTIAAAVAALMYVLSPIDLIPDFIPVIGLVDDALIIALCLSAIEVDLRDYAAWKKKSV